MHAQLKRHPLFLAFALLPFAAVGLAHAEMPEPQPAAAQHQAGFGTLKHIKAGLLDVAYAEVGPADGQVVILLHGWPYDIDSYANVAPLLAAKGYRVLIPYARGYGDTHFLSDKTLRTGSVGPGCDRLHGRAEDPASGARRL